MKGWHAACLALPFWMAHPAWAADDLTGAAREVARKSATLAKAEPIAVIWQNVSSLGPASLAQAHTAFEAAFREAGGRLADAAAPIEARITLSEDTAEYLLIEEIHRGEERQVWIAAWKRGKATPAAISAVIEKHLLWEQEEPILDAVLSGGIVWVLSPARLTGYREGGQAYTAKVSGAKPWPRDPRGRLRINGTGNTANIQANLPGTICTGTAGASFSLDCRPSDELWTLESGGRALLLASFAAARNYFDGRVVTQTGARKTVAPFYSAAAAEEEGGRPIWLLAQLDGRAGIFDASLDSIGSIPFLGSDLAGTDLRCGGRAAVLATRPGDGATGDAVDVYTIVNRAAVRIGSADFPGPVTALWSGGSLVAVVRVGERYQAYVLTVACP